MIYFSVLVRVQSDEFGFTPIQNLCTLDCQGCKFWIGRHTTQFRFFGFQWGKFNFTAENAEHAEFFRIFSAFSADSAVKFQAIPLNPKKPQFIILNADERGKREYFCPRSSAFVCVRFPVAYPKF